MASVFACGACGKECAGNLCRGCYRVFYCNAECQRDDWDEAHATDCCRRQKIGVDLQELFGERAAGSLGSADVSKTRLARLKDSVMEDLLEELGVAGRKRNVTWINNWTTTDVEDLAGAQRRINFLEGALAKLAEESRHVVPSTVDTFTKKGSLLRYLQKVKFLITISKTYPGTLTVLFHDPTNTANGYSKVNAVLVTNTVSKRFPYYLVTTGADQEEYARLPLDDPRRQSTQPEIVYGTLEGMILSLRSGIES